jgi:DNA adenine methylase
MRYHGGKFRLASWVVSHFPDHRVYVEPFGGAASVLMRKPRVHAEIYNDLDDEIVNVFRVLRNRTHGARLQELLELTPYSRTEFAESYDPIEDPIERARRTIVRSFMGFSSASVTKGHRTGFRPNSPRSRVTSAGDWANYSTHVEQFVKRLRGVAIENCNAFDLVRRYDSAETLFYVDPPYPAATRMAGSRHKDCYRFDMTPADHRALARLLIDVDGMVILSTYPNAMYDALYEGWTTVEKASQASGSRSSVPRIEQLLLSPATTRARTRK